MLRPKKEKSVVSFNNVQCVMCKSVLHTYSVSCVVWPISYSFNHRYNYRSYLSIFTALVKRNHSVTMVLPMVERLRFWPTFGPVKY